MEKTIKPYQYYFIKREVEQLISVYHSVNDSKTIETVQALAVERIEELVEPSQRMNLFLENILDTSLTKETAERLLEELKESVQPFEQPSESSNRKIIPKSEKAKTT